MTAHRYWRLEMTQCAYGPNEYLSLAEVQLQDSTGTNKIGSGTASSTTSYSGSSPSLACDGNASTYWQGQINGEWFWEYDFGSGNAFDIRTVEITSRATYGTQAPSAFSVEFSDDGTNWAVAGIFTATWGSTQTTQSFSITPTSGTNSNPHKYWRIYITADAYGPNAYPSLGEIQMCQRSDGTNQNGNATVTASAVYSTFSIADAMDGNASTYWTPGLSALPAWMQFSFATAVDIGSVIIQAQLATPSETPSAFEIQCSDDGSTWTTNNSFTPTWPSSGVGGEWQSFSVTAVAPAVTPVQASSFLFF
jgi:hypothetical protein